jgi:hypothetical protein
MGEHQMEFVKRVTYDVVLDATDVRRLMNIINTGIKHSPPTGYDMKQATPVIEKLNVFLKEYGRVDAIEAGVD